MRCEGARATTTVAEREWRRGVRAVGVSAAARLEALLHVQVRRRLVEHEDVRLLSGHHLDTQASGQDGRIAVSHQQPAMRSFLPRTRRNDMAAQRGAVRFRATTRRRLSRTPIAKRCSSPPDSCPT